MEQLRPDDKPNVNLDGIEEAVTDKGYHSGAVVKRMKAYGARSYIPEKKAKGRRNWAGKPAEQQAVYANRQRVRGRRTHSFAVLEPESSSATSLPPNLQVGCQVCRQNAHQAMSPAL